MSQVAISGNASGTGTLTIAAPNTNSNYTLTLPTNTGTLITTASTGQVIPKAALPAGSVLQVVSTTKTDTFSTSSTSFVDVTGLSVTITPTSTSSNILVFVSGVVGFGAGQLGLFNLLRGSTNISQPATSPSFTASTATLNNTDYISALSILFLDSPSTTSATTYKIQTRTNTGTLYVNRRNTADTATTTTITVMEIAT